MTFANLHRPNKIAVIGMGGIGEEVSTLLGAHNAAAFIDYWNRSKPWGDAQLTQADATTIERKFLAQQKTRNQAQIIAASMGDNNPPSFARRFGYENLETTLKDANIVVITAGTKRTPDISDREFLMKQNTPIIRAMAEKVRENPHAKNAIYIIATNPVDAMTQLFHEVSGIPYNKIIGLGGELDYARLIETLEGKLHIHANRIRNAQVIGQHGANMLPVLSRIEILDEHLQHPRKLTDILSADELEQLKKDTISGSDRLIADLGGSDPEAPAWAIHKMISAIAQGKPFIASARNDNDKTFIGRPVQVVEGKVQTLALPELTAAEKELWKKSYQACEASMHRVPDRQAGQSVA